jgi:NIMA (never in mitosis gene a)-related kinase 1/4/5
VQIIHFDDSIEFREKKMPPTTFSCDGVQWKKVKVLGKGSFGEAFLIETLLTPSTQAVCKLVHLAAMKPDEQREALNEVKVLSQLRHPNIVQYIGSFQADGYLHILMEYCNGGDVDQLIKKFKTLGNFMEEDLLATLFIQICSAIRYLHERRILHRDLKSQNVFLCRNEAAVGSGKYIVKLGDFGISTVLRNTLALAKTVCGTPYYFSPELCMNRPYNNKSDVWSLGCILYEMATLQHAFDAKNMKALMQRILTGKYNPVDARYHKSLQDLIDGMLQQKVEKRLSIQQVQKMQFVVQHTERLYQQYELDSSQKRRDKEMAAEAERQRRKAAEEPNMRMVSGMQESSPRNPRSVERDARSKAARQRRQDQDAQLQARNHDIEEQRRRKNLKAALRYDRNRDDIKDRMADLERLDDVRRRIEICSYEDQEKFVEKGWKLVQETKLRQDERGRDHDDRDRKLQELMEQMNAIDSKMRSRKIRRERGHEDFDAPPPAQQFAPSGLPPKPVRAPTARELALAYKNRVSAEAPWNRGREVPMGFTKESWDAHCKVMGHAVPIGGGGRAASREAPGSAHAPLPTATVGAPPPKGQLSDGDVSVLLKGEFQRLSKDPLFLQQLAADEEAKKKVTAMAEWEAQKARIRFNLGASQQNGKGESGSTSGPPPSRQAPPAPRSAVQQPQRPEQVRPASRSPPQAPKFDHPGFRFDNQGRFNENAQVPYRQQPQPPAHGSSDGAYESSRSSSTGSSSGSSVSSVDVEAEDYNDVIHAMKDQARHPEPPDLFEEAPLPANDLSRVANTVKFTLDGKTLHLDGVGANDPAEVRIEALRVFLSDALGGARTLERLIRSLQDIQSAGVDDTLADAMLAKLEAQYGNKGSLVDLAIQLVVCEAMLDPSS